MRPTSRHPRGIVTASVASIALLALGSCGKIPDQPPASPETQGAPAETQGAGAVHSSAMTALLVRSGIRTSMLAGDGTTVRDFIADVRKHASHVTVQVYDNEGGQIYVDRGPAPPRAQWPPELTRALDAGQLVSSDSGEWFAPLKNKASCQKCHDNQEWRGALYLASTPNLGSLSIGDQALGLTAIVQSAFDHIMTIGAVEPLGHYFESLREIMPGVVNSAVFSRDGHPTIGDAFMEAPPELVQRGLTSEDSFFEQRGDDLFVVTPLPNERSCKSCHEQGSKIRGAIVSHINVPEFQLAGSLLPLVQHSVYSVMLNNRGRLIHRHLADVSRSPLVSTVKLFDGVGRTFFSSEVEPNPPAEIAEALRTGQTEARSLVDHAGTTYVLPLASEAKCQRCHFDDSPLRGVLRVRMDNE